MDNSAAQGGESTMMSNTMGNGPVEAPEHVHELLRSLHARSLEQEKAFNISDIPKDSFDAFMEDKFVALEEHKCQLVYQLIRASGARNVVEAGTSFGVSTIYLALAVNRNIQTLGGSGTVIGTEKEAAKAEQARQHWRQCGQDTLDRIDLREGDLRETLGRDMPKVDMLLLDIWAPMALPALKLVEPHFRPGAIVLCDNSISSAARYKDLQAYMRRPGSGYANLTMPYHNGFEMSVFSGSS